MAATRKEAEAEAGATVEVERGGRAVAACGHGAACLRGNACRSVASAASDCSASLSEDARASRVESTGAEHSPKASCCRATARLPVGPSGTSSSLDVGEAGCGGHGEASGC